MHKKNYEMNQWKRIVNWSPLISFALFAIHLPAKQHSWKITDNYKID